MRMTYRLSAEDWGTGSFFLPRAVRLWPIKLENRGLIPLKKAGSMRRGLLLPMSSRRFCDSYGCWIERSSMLSRFTDPRIVL